MSARSTSSDLSAAQSEPVPNQPQNRRENKYIEEARPTLLTRRDIVHKSLDAMGVPAKKAIEAAAAEAVEAETKAEKAPAAEATPVEAKSPTPAPVVERGDYANNLLSENRRPFIYNREAFANATDRNQVATVTNITDPRRAQALMADASREQIQGAFDGQQIEATIESTPAQPEPTAEKSEADANKERLKLVREQVDAQVAKSESSLTDDIDDENILQIFRKQAGTSKVETRAA